MPSKEGVSHWSYKVSGGGGAFIRVVVRDRGEMKQKVGTKEVRMCSFAVTFIDPTSPDMQATSIHTFRVGKSAERNREDAIMEALELHLVDPGTWSEYREVSGIDTRDMAAFSRYSTMVKSYAAGYWVALVGEYHGGIRGRITSSKI